MGSSIQYKPGTKRRDARLGDVHVHVFEDAIGIDSIVVPEHSIFILARGVSMVDILESGELPRHTYGAGSIRFLPAGTHLSSVDVSAPYTETMIRVPESAFRQAARDKICYNSLQWSFVRAPAEKTFGVAQTLANVAMAENPSPLFVDAVINALCIGVMCTNMDRTYEATRQVPGGLSPERQRRVVEFIEKNLSETITLSDVAHVAALSPFHFNRAFRASMGTTPSRYVMSMRALRAKRMLCDRTMQIACVAMECGFSNQSHFTTAFKKATGMTPAEWRRNN